MARASNIAALASARRHPHTRRAYRRLLHLIDLYVPGASRRQGIGRTLMSAFARPRSPTGAQVVLWSVYRPNELASRFYEALGAKIVRDLDWMAWDIWPRPYVGGRRRRAAVLCSGRSSN